MCSEPQSTQVHSCKEPGVRRPDEKNTSSKKQAIVYDPCFHKHDTEEWILQDSKSSRNQNTAYSYVEKAKYSRFDVRLPLWRNRVDIYVDPENKTGFVATVQLSQLGSAKNWQRRLRQNYTVLRVKGKCLSDSPSSSVKSIAHAK